MSSALPGVLAVSLLSPACAGLLLLLLLLLLEVSWGKHTWCLFRHSGHLLLSCPARLLLLLLLLSPCCPHCCWSTATTVLLPSSLPRNKTSFP
jgi:hypothetical protein